MSFQWVNKLSIPSFGNGINKKVHTRHYLPEIEIKYCKVMINGKISVDQPVEVIWKHMIIFKKM